MADTVKSNAAKIKQLRSDVASIASIAYDLTKLLMQDKSVPALAAHRGKWKTVLNKLETIIKQERDVPQEDEDGS